MIKHQYKNFVIDIPRHWKYEDEEGDMEVCFDPAAKGGFRIHIMQVVFPASKTKEQAIADLTSKKPYKLTSRNYLLCGPEVFEEEEEGNNINLFQWKLIDISALHAQIALLTYTVLADERESEDEKQVVALLNNSISSALFV